LASCAFLAAHEAAGAQDTRFSLRPLLFRGVCLWQLGRVSRRGNACTCPPRCLTGCIEEPLARRRDDQVRRSKTIAFPGRNLLGTRDLFPPLPGGGQHEVRFICTDRTLRGEFSGIGDADRAACDIQRVKRLCDRQARWSRPSLWLASRPRPPLRMVSRAPSRLVALKRDGS
jgi:hypothetical protein